MRQELFERFKQESKSLALFREQQLARVVRWLYSKDELWSCWDMREKAPEDSALSGPDGAIYAYGFDELGRRIVVRQFRCESVWVPENAKSPGSPPELEVVPSKQVFREHYIRYGDDCLHISVIECDSLKSVWRLEFKDHLLMESEQFDYGSYGRALFFYEGRRKKKQQWFSDRERLSMEIHYGPHGEQSFFRVRRDGTLFQLGQPLPKAVTAKKLKATVHERLMLLVPELLGEANIDEPIYCVALAYDGEGNDVLPPLVGIGVESERQKWVNEHGAKARDWIWNPAEFYHFEKPHTQLEDDSLEEAAHLLNNHLAERDSLAPAMKLLIEVATQLNAITWPANVRRTPDFLVYAVDFELGSLRKNMKSCLSPEQFKDLKTRKLV
jgi:hypothetical protein